jgi:hypothetical protein
VACDWIERILQTFFCAQEEARPTADVASHRGRIFAYAEGVDGQVEGLPVFTKLFILSSIFLTGCTFLTGKRLGGHVTCVPLSDICSRLKISALETVATHRANSLLAILPNALETGFSEVYPEREPLKVCAKSRLSCTKLKITEL